MQGISIILRIRNQLSDNLDYEKIIFLFYFRHSVTMSPEHKFNRHRHRYHTYHGRDSDSTSLSDSPASRYSMSTQYRSVDSEVLIR